jgi:nucleotide-binding universal stress UspA family protein
MKSVLLYANDDQGLESRFQAALDAVRLFEGHLTCIQATPFDSYIIGDPFGGVYAMPSIMGEVRAADDAHRARMEERLRREGVSWEWLHHDGNPAQTVVDRSRLCDLIVLSLPTPTDGIAHERALALTGEVAIHARTPVLAVPQASRGVDALGPALVAWNGAPESSNALRLALPMLRQASVVHVVTVAEDGGEFPAVDACTYLARHGIQAELHEWPRDGNSTAEALIEAAARLGATYVLMGAYGHSRFREAVVGGVTREMLLRSPVPLLLGH